MHVWLIGRFEAFHAKICGGGNGVFSYFFKDLLYLEF
jgi:hypothetical protein